MAPPVDLARTRSLDDEVRASEYGTDLEAAPPASAQVSAAGYPCSEECAPELALRRSRQDSGVYVDDAAALQAVVRQSRCEARVRRRVAGHESFGRDIAGDGPVTPPPSPTDSRKRSRERERAQEGAEIVSALAASMAYDWRDEARTNSRYSCSENAALDFAIGASMLDSGSYTDDVAALRQATERSMWPRGVPPPVSPPPPAPALPPPPRLPPPTLAELNTLTTDDLRLLLDGGDSPVLRGRVRRLLDARAPPPPPPPLPPLPAPPPPPPILRPPSPPRLPPPRPPLPPPLPPYGVAFGTAQRPSRQLADAPPGVAVGVLVGVQIGTAVAYRPRRPDMSYRASVTLPAPTGAAGKRSRDSR